MSAVFERSEIEQRAADAVKNGAMQRVHFPAANIRELEVDDATKRKPIEAVINTSDIDHYESIVDPMGANFDDYNANPVVLYAHGNDPQVGDWPVGRCLKLTRTAGEIVAELEFDVEGKLHGDENKRLGAELDRMYRDGWLRGFSVGFIPTDYELRMIDEREYIVYTGWKLMEFSAVAVPGNPKALKRALAAGQLTIETPQLRDDIEAATTEQPTEPPPAPVAAGEPPTTNDDPTDASNPAPQPAPADEPTEAERQLAELRAEYEALKRQVVERQPEPEPPAVDWQGEWKLEAECRACSPAALRESAALMVGADAWLPHHRATGELSWRGLAQAMGTLLTQPLDLTSEQRESAFCHLAEHYRELGITPPEAGGKSPDEAYDLALEGRVGLVDDAGYVWLYREAIKQGEVMVPVFERVDDSAARQRGHVPPAGRLTDHRRWGKRSAAAPSGSEAVLRELADTQRRLADLMDGRAGAEFSTKNKTRITNAANDLEQLSDTLRKSADATAGAATYLRGMIESTADEEAKGVGGVESRDSGPGSDSAPDEPRTGFRRAI